MKLRELKSVAKSRSGKKGAILESSKAEIDEARDKNQSMRWTARYRCYWIGDWYGNKGELNTCGPRRHGVRVEIRMTTADYSILPDHCPFLSFFLSFQRELSKVR